MNINFMVQGTAFTTFVDGGAMSDLATGNETTGGNGTGGYTGSNNGEAPQQTSGGGFFGGPMMTFVWIGILFIAMYLVLFRPQKKREKQMREMQEQLRVGDHVLTSGGLYGKIAGVGADAFLVELGENRGVRVWVRKSDVLGVKEPSTTPPPADKTEEKAEDKKEDK